MGVGVALSKEETYKKFTRLTGAMVFSLMGRNRSKRDLRDKIAEKMSKKLHMSNRVAISMFPYMEIMFENDNVAYDIANFLGLHEDEIKRFRKRKIPKSVIKRKEKERQEKLAKKKLKFNSKIESKESIFNSSESVLTNSLSDKLSKSDLNQDTQFDKSIISNNSNNSKKSNSSNESFKINNSKEKIRKSTTNKQSKNKSTKSTKEKIEKNSGTENKHESEEPKSNSAQKSLFNF